jgi:hypothetical protein
MNRLSACTITLKEEQNLPRALASLSSVADEIVVIDAGYRKPGQLVEDAAKPEQA